MFRYYCCSTKLSKITKPVSKLLSMKMSDLSLEFKRIRDLPTEEGTHPFRKCFRIYECSETAQYYAWMKKNEADLRKGMISLLGLENPKTVIINDYSRFHFYDLDFCSGTPFWYGILAHFLRKYT